MRERVKSWSARWRAGLAAIIAVGFAPISVASQSDLILFAVAEATERRFSLSHESRVQNLDRRFSSAR